jgi:hypothetical protein
MWKLLAFTARYGNQPLSELLDLEVSDLVAFAKQLGEILKEENTPRK